MRCPLAHIPFGIGRKLLIKFLQLCQADNLQLLASTVYTNKHKVSRSANLLCKASHAQQAQMKSTTMATPSCPSCCHTFWQSKLKAEAGTLLLESELSRCRVWVLFAAAAAARTTLKKSSEPCWPFALVLQAQLALIVESTTRHGWHTHFGSL